jgi:hypothetical protein
MNLAPECPSIGRILSEQGDAASPRGAQTRKRRPMSRMMPVSLLAVLLATVMAH